MITHPPRTRCANRAVSGALSGRAMVRTAAGAGFDMGARFVWIGATRLGIPIYHKVGFTELGVEYLEYRFPVPNGR